MTLSTINMQSLGDQVNRLLPASRFVETKYKVVRLHTHCGAIRMKTKAIIPRSAYTVNVAHQHARRLLPSDVYTFQQLRARSILISFTPADTRR
jgi:hypothetical protein